MVDYPPRHKKDLELVARRGVTRLHDPNYIPPGYVPLPKATSLNGVTKKNPDNISALVIHDERVAGGRLKAEKFWNTHYGKKRIVEVGMRTPLEELYTRVERAATAIGRPGIVIIDCHGLPGLLLLAQEMVYKDNVEAFGARLGRTLNRTYKNSQWWPRIIIGACWVAHPDLSGTKKAEYAGKTVDPSLTPLGDVSPYISNGHLFCRALARAANCAVVAATIPQNYNEPELGVLDTPTWDGLVYTFDPSGGVMRIERGEHLGNSQLY